MSWHQEGCSGLWRSEDMVRVNIILQREVLHDTMFEVGMLGRVQFLDANEGIAAFARPYTEDLRRCEELQRKLHFIEESLRKEPELLERYSTDINMSATVEEMRSSLMQGQMNVIDDRIESTVSELNAMLMSLEGFQSELNRNQEMEVLYQTYQQMVYAHADEPMSDEAAEAPGSHVGSASARSSAVISAEAFSRLSSLFGLLDTTRAEELYRLCYRVSRGNAIVEISNAPELFVDTKTGERNVSKTAFVVLCSSPLVITRLKKLVGGLGASVYTLEEVHTHGAEIALSPNAHHVEDTVEGVERRKRDVLQLWYEEHRLYKTYLKVEKVVLTAMNMCAMAGSTCTASAWVPLRHEQALRRALQDAVASANGSVESIVAHHADQKHPPTFFETNRFTEAFQGIVSSYGIARYKEVNPGVFTIITFPYLFGIMYGDIGHGVLLLLIALYFIYKERAWRTVQLNEIVAMVFGGRYLLLLMSLYAIYMGLLYNDFFGFSLNLFSSGYTWAPITAQNGTTYPTTPNGLPSVKPSHVYALGLDAAWSETDNKLELYNSVKMKHAVIVGTVQMFAGLFLSLHNSVYERNWFKVAFLFVPEFVFLFSTFGYMCILILVKWGTTWRNTNDAPSILETMTNFFLAPGTVTKSLYKGQAGLQIFLLLLAFLMVPLMLLGMPYIEMREYKRWKQRRFGGGGGGGAQHASMVVIENEDSADGFFNEPSTSVQTATAASQRQTRADGGNDRSAAASPPPPTHDLISDDEQALYNAAVFFGDDSMDPYGGAAADMDNAAVRAREEEDEHFEHFDVSELVIHYVIHTIEYVLGSVSNTASYLRLWALSLAHAQLSEVFFTFTVVNVLSVKDSSGFVIAIGVMLWIVVTFAVLVGMEALSAFLHALRLHWMEFQNKFYVGDGKAFDPMDLLSLNAHN
ncbi:putative vacuolar proton-ATPase-like protein [Leptomonas pyrrhocoris]|uniref:V-type proton ATPase subunit a n=1 Tax=Leptomonas pyrrhocoris TaxID=157538 RepID=A0A0N0DYX0_LEPPY|nr:putative vacuolar proton-ATPase-like protein [Leptomonas pyrrhocoris]KPA84612.1 putative vacuolar proton-ATPase-like protein [Leptomonas pyrrhocoris]|eukprot:XP_015663051.1 putative vacuolar proton-ATPase-like protein [Leptomonas pyrrhocoris]